MSHSRPSVTRLQLILLCVAFVLAFGAVAVAQDAAPKGDAAAAGDKAPADAPADAAPADPAPTDTAPTDAAPGDAAPADTAPADAGSADGAAGDPAAGAAGDAANAAAFDDKLALRLPKGWKIKPIHSDAQSHVYFVSGLAKDVLIELYVMNVPAMGVDASDPKALAKEANALGGAFYGVERNMDFKFKGRTPINLAGCPAASQKYKDGKHHVQMVTCLHQDRTRLYVVRLDLPAEIEEQHEDLLKNFDGFLFSAMALVGPDGKPYPPPAKVKKPAKKP